MTVLLAALAILFTTTISLICFNQYEAAFVSAATFLLTLGVSPMWLAKIQVGGA